MFLFCRRPRLPSAPASESLRVRDCNSLPSRKYNALRLPIVTRIHFCSVVGTSSRRRTPHRLSGIFSPNHHVMHVSDLTAPSFPPSNLRRSYSGSAAAHFSTSSRSLAAGGVNTTIADTVRALRLSSPHVGDTRVHAAAGLAALQALELCKYSVLLRTCPYAS